MASLPGITNNFLNMLPKTIMLSKPHGGLVNILIKVVNNNKIMKEVQGGLRCKLLRACGLQVLD